MSIAAELLPSASTILIVFRDPTLTEIVPVASEVIPDFCTTIVPELGALVGSKVYELASAVT